MTIGRFMKPKKNIGESKNVTVNVSRVVEVEKAIAVMMDKIAQDFNADPLKINEYDIGYYNGLDAVRVMLEKDESMALSLSTLMEAREKYEESLKTDTDVVGFQMGFCAPDCDCDEEELEDE